MAGSAPARIVPLNVTHALRGKVNFTHTAGVEIGTLPAGAMVLRTHVYVPAGTVFVGTSPTLDIGTAATLAAFMATAAALPAAAGFKTGTGTGMGDTLLVDTPVVAKVGGTGLSAGEAQVVVEFYPQKT